MTTSAPRGCRGTPRWPRAARPGQRPQPRPCPPHPHRCSRGRGRREGWTEGWRQGEAPRRWRLLAALEGQRRQNRRATHPEDEAVAEQRVRQLRLHGGDSDRVPPALEPPPLQRLRARLRSARASRRGRGHLQHRPLSARPCPQRPGVTARLTNHSGRGARSRQSR